MSTSEIWNDVSHIAMMFTNTKGYLHFGFNTVDYAQTILALIISRDQREHDTRWKPHLMPHVSDPDLQLVTLVINGCIRQSAFAFFMYIEV